MMKKTPLLAIGALTLVCAPGAGAHAEATPSKVPADSVATIVLRVEGEETVSAVKVAVQLPTGVSDLSFRPARGWKRRVKRRVVTWSGGEIEKGKFGTFVFKARMPNSPGTELVFPTVETYANGKAVHWIGEESSDTPAPRVQLTAAETRTPPPPPVTTMASAEQEDDGDSLVWLLVGGAAVALTVSALVVLRRRR
jgi:uncharacterized protein YcnI